MKVTSSGGVIVKPVCLVEQRHDESQGNRPHIHDGTVSALRRQNCPPSIPILTNQSPSTRFRSEDSRRRHALHLTRVGRVESTKGFPIPQVTSPRGPEGRAARKEPIHAQRDPSAILRQPSPWSERPCRWGRDRGMPASVEDDAPPRSARTPMYAPCSCTMHAGNRCSG